MEFGPESMLRAGDRQVSARLGDESIILGIASGGYFGLDGVGTFVWERLQEPVRVRDLERAITEAYDVDPDRCAADLRALLAQLESEGLIDRVDG